MATVQDPYPGTQHRVAICAPFRDETRYLREWLEYHRLVGVEHAFLLCNDDPEEHGAVSDVLGPYVDAGFVTWDLFSDRGPDWQLSCWWHILAEWGHLTEWLCMTDMDAFLFPVRTQSVLPVLADYALPGVAALAVYTCTFGSNDVLTSPPLQTEAFLRRAELGHASNWTANYIVRPHLLDPAARNQGRYVQPLPGYHLIDENLHRIGHKGKRPGPQQRLRLNHYSVRSRADWARKVRRHWPATGWDDKNQTIEEHKLNMLDRNEVYDDSMLRFVPQLKKALGL